MDSDSGGCRMIARRRLIVPLLAWTLAGFVCGQVPAQLVPVPNDGVPRPGSPLYAAKLGIKFQFVPYRHWLVAKLTEYPATGSPFARLQLEPGDMIVSL